MREMGPWVSVDSATPVASVGIVGGWFTGSQSLRVHGGRADGAVAMRGIYIPLGFCLCLVIAGGIMLLALHRLSMLTCMVLDDALGLAGHCGFVGLP